jgi:hypothetical protein
MVNSGMTVLTVFYMHSLDDEYVNEYKDVACDLMFIYKVRYTMHKRWKRFNMETKISTK